MNKVGWAKGLNAIKRHYYLFGDSAPLCGKNVPHVIGERDPKGSRHPFVDCQSCKQKLRKLHAPPAP